jgi:dihydropyrimidinase
VCVTWWSDKVSQEMETLVKEKGLNSFHVSLSNGSDHIAWQDRDLYQLMRRCKDIRALLLVHAENGSLIDEKTRDILSLGITGPEGHLLSRPEEAEAEAVYRAIALASLVNVPIYITKVMSQMSADVISDSRRKGKVIYGEVIPAALALDGGHYLNGSWRHAAGYVVSPPLRSDPTTCEHLGNLLANDDLQLTSSDHCTFDANQKAIGKDDFSKIPSGANGVEERMSIVWEKLVMTGKMDANRFVAVTSTNAAKVFNIYPKKGRIAIGSDADILIWDPEAMRTISSASQQHKGDFNIFEGLSCHGVPVYVINGGCVALDEEGVRVTQGSGQFVSTSAGCEHVYTRILERDKLSRPQKVVRDPYTGPALSYNVSNDQHPKTPVNPINAASTKSEEFHNRGNTRSGGRHLQDSSFSLSGAQIDDSQPARASMKVSQPPGGKSNIPW